MIFLLLKLFLLISLIIVLTQDLQVYPLAFSSLFYKKQNRDPETLPNGVQSFFLETPDNNKIEVWHVPAHIENKRNETVLIFHGNGELVDTNIDQQRWFAEHGWDSYSFDYRGYGRSNGWPSEKGISLDSDAVWNYLKDKTTPDKTILVGYSLGSAPAARLASIIKPKTLLIIAGYASVRKVVLDRIIFAPLIFFLWTKFSTIEYVSKLEATNLIITHGKADLVVRFHHMQEISKHYKGTGRLITIEHDTASHLEIFWLTKQKLLKELIT